MTLTLNYNSTANHIAYYPIANTLIGAYRLVANITALVIHLISATHHPVMKKDAIYMQIFIITDLKQILRGILEILPIIGGLFGLLFDQYFLSPAQKLAYRIHHIYQTRLGALNNFDKKGLRPLSEIDLANASPDFVRFINKQPVMISTDQTKIAAFIQAFVHNVDFNHPVFQDPHLPFYALAAFYQQAIDANDIATVLEIYIAKICYQEFQVHPMLNENFQWTREAQTKLIRSLEVDRKFAKAINSIELESFRNKIATLKPHKRIFYSHKSLASLENLKNVQTYFEFFTSPVGSVYMKSLASGLIHHHDNEDMHMSLEAESLFLNAKYSTQGSSLEPRLGLFTPRDIRAEVQKRKRLCATFFPGIEGATIIHQSQELPGTTIVHDKGHAHILHMYPKAIVDFMLDLSALFEQITGMSMTKEIWELSDMIVEKALSNTWQLRGKDLRSTLSSFLELLAVSSGDGPIDCLWEKLLFNDDDSPTLLGGLIVLNCIDDPDKWGDINTISAPLFRRAAAQAREFYRLKIFSKADAPIIKLWKLMNANQLPATHGTITAEHLAFQRITSGPRKNTITIIRL